jgi:ribosomal protein S18 acetylase RimI-like enzyme
MKHKLNESDFKQIALLHYASLGNGFLALLGCEFLYMLYKQIYHSKKSFIIVKRKNNKIIGFVAGGSGLRDVYVGLLKNPFKLFFVILPMLRKPSVFVKILFIVFRNSNINSCRIKLIDAELYSIVVQKDYRGSSIGKDLYKGICKYFYNCGVSDFCIVVGDNLIQAKKFYFTQGAIAIGSIKQGGDKTSTVFKQTITSENL